MGGRRTVLHVSRLICAFQDRYPDIGVNLSLTDERVDLVREGVDIALRQGPLTDSPTNLRALDRVWTGGRLPSSNPSNSTFSHDATEPVCSRRISAACVSSWDVRCQDSAVTMR
jgi:DNA-binding transcriptional LysR family regulator